MFRKNVDSGVEVPANIWDEVVGRLKYLATAYTNVPIYLVNPSTMDKIKPPETGYDPECVKRSMEKVSDVIARDWAEREKIRGPEDSRRRHAETIERAWEMLSECKGMTYPTVGVYTEDAHKIREHTGENESRAIFICPERIYNSNHSKPDIVFQFVVLHELAHAYHGMCKYYSKDWGKVIEESLANAVAYVNFEKTEKNAILEHISQQPCEYKGYTFWDPDSEPNAIRFWFRLWRSSVPSAFTISDYHDFLHRFFHDYHEIIWDIYRIRLMYMHGLLHKFIHEFLQELIHEFIRNKNPELFYKFLAVEILREGTA
jgi:hypothetical protein